MVRSSFLPRWNAWLTVAACLAGQASGADYECPPYTSIAQPNVAAPAFKLSDFTGEWYVMATNEPTMPSFCTCGVLTWSVDGDPSASVKHYHYTFAPRCLGKGVSITCKGEARDPQHPGSLMENAALFNHTVAKLVPNMIFDKVTLADGNVIGFTYACIGTIVGHKLFSFNVLARRPTLSSAQVADMVAQRQNASGGVFDVKSMRYADAAKCWPSQTAESVPAGETLQTMLV